MSTFGGEVVRHWQVLMVLIFHCIVRPPIPNGLHILKLLKGKKRRDLRIYLYLYNISAFSFDKKLAKRILAVNLVGVASSGEKAVKLYLHFYEIL